MTQIAPNSSWTSRIALCCLIALSSMFAFTCRVSKTEELPQKDKKAVLSDKGLSDSTLHLIRNEIINKGQLSNEEKKTIMETAPQVGRYKLAGEFKQYKWRWDLPTGRSALVSFTGFIESIDVNELQIAVIVSKE